jgi:HPt (histidine-containing phosphotransfer) domain-containing protein
MREDINKSLQAGAVGYITKPIDFNKFFLQIGKFLKVKVDKGKGEEMARGSGYQYRLKSESARGYEYQIKDGISEKVRNIFLTDVREKLGIIRGILETGDFENKRDMVETIVHGYMGNAVYFGLPVLEATAKELDQAFKDIVPIQTLINKTMELAAILKRIIEENTNSSQSVIPG